MDLLITSEGRICHVMSGSIDACIVNWEWYRENYPDVTGHFDCHHYRCTIAEDGNWIVMRFCENLEPPRYYQSLKKALIFMETHIPC